VPDFWDLSFLGTVKEIAAKIGGVKAAEADSGGVILLQISSEINFGDICRVEVWLHRDSPFAFDLYVNRATAWIAVSPCLKLLGLTCTHSILRAIFPTNILKTTAHRRWFPEPAENYPTTSPYHFSYTPCAHNSTSMARVLSLKVLMYLTLKCLYHRILAGRLRWSSLFKTWNICAPLKFFQPPPFSPHTALHTPPSLVRQISVIRQIVAPLIFCRQLWTRFKECISLICVYFIDLR